MPTHATYAALPGVNWSTLKLIDTSPLMLKYRAVHPDGDTPAKLVGRAVHCAVLEPELFDATYAVRPGFVDDDGRPLDGRTKAGKAAREAWASRCPPGAVVLDAEQGRSVLAAQRSVRSHPVASPLLTDGRSEVTIQWVDEATRLPCKAQLDYLRPHVLVDLKTTRAQTRRDFGREFTRLLYYGQLAWYHDGAIAAGVLPRDDAAPYVVAVQNCEPYDVVAVDRLSARALGSGRLLYRRLLTLYAECSAANWWPGLCSDVGEIDVEEWAAVTEPPEASDSAPEW